MHVPPDALPPRPSFAAALLGGVRISVVVGLLVVGTVAVLVASLLPVRLGEARPAERVAQGLARAFLWATGVTLRVDHPERLVGHRGFVFFNHLSWIDPVVLVAVRPLRFLSTLGVRYLPFVGWMATALGTIYVHRGRGGSREKARAALTEAVASSPTPVAVAPEGKIGLGPGVLPFRHGAFEVAADAEADVRLVALRFEPHAHALWQDREWLTAALWRLCARTEPFVATVTPLAPTLDPDAGTSADLAVEAERRLDAVLVPEAAASALATPPRPAP
ncbi:MAG: lysophospholipid acyltransferase family protein [Bacteroidota bacterium]